MELQQDRGAGPFIDAYQPGELKVEQQSYHSSILVQTDKQVDIWAPRDLTQLTPADLQPLIALKPVLVLLGTGEKLTFPPLELLNSLYAAQIGVEVMDTAAACRTYNVLMAEGRDVLAALLLY